MSILWLLLGFATCVLIGYRAALTYLRARAARVQIAEAVPYAREGDDHSKALLVLGDSTGVGVGASRPEETLAGLVAAAIGATYVENHAVSGATVDDLAPQIEVARLSRYDTILIQIGANDIIMLRDARRTAMRLDAILMSLPEARRIILLSAGNVGGANIFPFVIRPFHTWTTLAFHRWFAKVAERRGGVYVNLYDKPENDRFITDPDRYFSEDGLHPSSEGYALWFEKVRPHLI